MTEEKQLVEAIIEGIQERKGKSITHVDMSDIEGATTRGFVTARLNVLKIRINVINFVFFGE